MTLGSRPFWLTSAPHRVYFLALCASVCAFLFFLPAASSLHVLLSFYSLLHAFVSLMRSARGTITRCCLNKPLQPLLVYRCAACCRLVLEVYSLILFIGRQSLSHALLLSRDFTWLSLACVGAEDKAFFESKRKEAAEAEAERLAKEQEAISVMTEEERAVCVPLHAVAVFLHTPRVLRD